MTDEVDVVGGGDGGGDGSGKLHSLLPQMESCKVVRCATAIHDLGIHGSGTGEMVIRVRGILG